jgi:hypothetical protein
MFRYLLIALLLLMSFDLSAKTKNICPVKEDENPEEILFGLINASLVGLDSLQKTKGDSSHCWSYVNCADLPNCSGDHASDSTKCFGCVSFFSKDKTAPRCVKIIIDSAYYKAALVYLVSYSPKNLTTRHYRSLFFEYNYLLPHWHYKFNNVVRHATVINKNGQPEITCDDSNDKLDAFTSKFGPVFKKIESSRIK